MTCKRAVAIEIRAAELGIDAPRGTPGQEDCCYSREEFKGYALHYWCEYGKSCNRAPRTDAQQAGWLARVIFQAGE